MYRWQYACSGLGNVFSPIALFRTQFDPRNSRSIISARYQIALLRQVSSSIPRVQEGTFAFAFNSLSSAATASMSFKLP